MPGKSCSRVVDRPSLLVAVRRTFHGAPGSGRVSGTGRPAYLRSTNRQPEPELELKFWAFFGKCEEAYPLVSYNAAVSCENRESARRHRLEVQSESLHL